MGRAAEFVEFPTSDSLRLFETFETFEIKYCKKKMCTPLCVISWDPCAFS